MKLYQIIDGALKKLGVVGAGETVSPDEHKDGLETLKEVVDSLSVEGLIIPARRELVYTTDTDWENPEMTGVAPISVNSIFFRDTNGVDHPLRTMTFDEWAKIPYKNVSGMPGRYHAETNDMGMALYLDAIPPSSWELHIIGKIPLYNTIDFTDPYAEVELAYGYESLLKYLLAIELAPMYGVTNIQNLVALAMDKKQNLMAQNYKEYTLQFDEELGHAKNTAGFIYTTK